MRTMLWSVLLLGISGTVSAGPITSGGGKTYACFTQTGELATAEVLDLFEGRAVFADQHLDDGQTVDEYLEIASQRLDQTGYNLAFGQIKNIRQSIQLVKNRMRILPNNVEPTETNDSFELISASGNCRVAQLAFFADASTIAVSKKYWQRLSNLGQAALILHEAIYWMDRQIKEVQDSRRARRITSLALGKDWPFESVFNGEPMSYILCNSLDFPKSVFIVYPQNQVQVIQHFALNGDLLISKSISATYEFPFLDATVDRQATYSSTDYVQSAFESETKIKFERLAEGFATLTAEKRTYPQWTSQTTNLICSTINR